MTISGTKEWSVESVNCVTGCSHNCRYCYARAMALRFHRIKRPEDWATMQVRWAEVHPKIRWKESFKKVLGLKFSTEAGLDI